MPNTSAPSNCTAAPPTVHYTLEYVHGPNMLGLIVFSIAFAIVLSRLGREGQRVLEFMSILNLAMMKMVDIVMW